MKIHTLVLGFGVASNAYTSLLDYNKIRTSIIGSPLDRKKINTLKKIKKDKVLKLKYSKNIHFYNEDEIKLIDHASINLIIVGTNTKGIDWAINTNYDQINRSC